MNEYGYKRRMLLLQLRVAAAAVNENPLTD